MKKILSKFKKYSFWVAFTGVVVIFIKNIAQIFGLVIDTGIIENVIMSLCGVLIVLGLVIKDDNESEIVEENVIEENAQEITENKDVSVSSDILKNEDKDTKK